MQVGSLEDSGQFGDPQHFDANANPHLILFGVTRVRVSERYTHLTILPLQSYPSCLYFVSDRTDQSSDAGKSRRYSVGDTDSNPYFKAGTIDICLLA